MPTKSSLGNLLGNIPAKQAKLLITISGRHKKPRSWGVIRGLLGGETFAVLN